MRVIHGVEVRGEPVDGNTRCVHYGSELDVIAINFKCCGRWYPCRECHDHTESHEALVWPTQQFDTPAILCGVCGHQLTINSYLSCGSLCPECDATFNPRCAHHHHLYFET